MTTKRHSVHFDVTAKDSASGPLSAVERGLLAVEKSLAGVMLASISIGGAGASFVAFVGEAMKMRSALDDLSDTTGDNIKTLDGLRRQAAISGVEFDQLSGGLTKFARNLNAADDEGKAASQAIVRLGLDVAALRAMKPADAMIEVALALGKFEDGAGKVAVATALMGKEGAKLLPYLKDIAEAGGVQGRITAEQAAAAEQLEKQWRALKQAFRDGGDAMVDVVIPSLRGMAAEMQEGIRIAGGFGAAIRMFGTIDPGPSLHQNIRETTEELRKWQEAGSVGRFFTKPLGATYAGTEGELKKKIEFLKFMQREEALMLAGPGSEDSRDIRARMKPALDFVPEGKGNKGVAGPDYTHLFQTYEMLKEAWKEGEKIRRDEAAAGEAQRLASEKLESAYAAEAEGIRRMIDPTRIYHQQMARTDELLMSGKISQDEASAALARYQTQIDIIIAKDLPRELEKTNEIGRELGLTFTSTFEDAILEGKKFSDVLMGIEKDIARIILRKTITEPLAEGMGGLFKGFSLASLFGGGGAGMSSGAFGIGFMGFAEGTDYVPRDMVAKVHKGEAIIPAWENARGDRGGPNIVIGTIDNRGASLEAVQATQRMLANLNASIEPRALVAMRQARVRGFA